MVTPLILQGQSPYMILRNHPEIALSEKTLYNYIESGALSVKNIDLPKKVKYKVRSCSSSEAADLTIYDPTSHQAVYTIVNGRFVLLNRVLQTGTGTLLTTYEGTQAAQNRGLKTQVVSGIVPLLHRSL